MTSIYTSIDTRSYPRSEELELHWMDLLDSHETGRAHSVGTYELRNDLLQALVMSTKVLAVGVHISLLDAALLALFELGRVVRIKGLST